MQETLVFIPDIFCDIKVFASQIAQFSDFASVMFVPLPALDRVQDMSARVAEQIPPNSILIGSGLGGAVAIDVQRRAPERVLKLVLISTDPLSESPQNIAALEPAIAKARSGQIEDVVRERMGKGMFVKSADGMVLQNQIVAAAQRLGSEKLVAHLRAYQRRPDFQSNLRRIVIPSLVISGGADGVCSAQRQELAANLIPRAAFIKVENAGHFPSLEQPQEVTGVLQDWVFR